MTYRTITSFKITSILFLILVVMSGCSDPLKVEKSPNGTISYLMAVVDGCNLWRIDLQTGKDIYAIICPSSGDSTTSVDIICGRHCRRNQTVVTSIHRDPKP